MYGINLGSYNIGISHLIESNIKILLSLSSNRTFRNIITISKENERYFGDLAMLSYLSNVEKTIFNPQRFLTEDNSNLLTDCSFLNEDFSQLSKIDCVYNSKFFKAIVSMFSKINNVINKDLQDQMQLNKSILKEKSFLTLSIQDFFSLQERYILINALRCSLLSKMPLNDYNLKNYEKINEYVSKQSLKEISFLNESSALTLFYGFDRRKELSHLNESKIVCFVDIGHSKSTITFSSFIKEEFKVLYVASNRNFGARNLDTSIMKLILNEFITSNQLSITAKNIRKKSMMNFYEEIAKSRKTLTVNNESTIMVNNFFEDIDLVFTLKKDKFENIIQKDLEDLKFFLTELFSKYQKISNKQISNVELAGEAVRIPKIQDVIESVFNSKLSKTLLPDEAIAKGCCIYSIMQSNKYSFNYDFKLSQYSNIEIFLEFPIKKEKTSEGINNKNGKFEIYNLNHKILDISDTFPLRKVFKIYNPLDEIKFTFKTKEISICK